VLTTSHDEFTRAVQLHCSGDLAAATRLYESILGRDRSHADAFHLLGVARHQQGQSGLAAELIGRAVALRPGAAVFRATLGEAYRALGQFDRAAGCCRAALALGLDDPAVHNNLGLALQALGLYTEAEVSFRSALALRPNDATTHTNLGAALQAQGAGEAALDHFRRAVAIDPTLAPARTNLGQVLLDLGRPGEALPHCLAAVSLQPDLSEAHNNLGNAHRALGRLDEAKACYTEALRRNPSLAQAHVCMAKTLQEEERWDDALPWLRRATEVQPGSLVFLALLAEAAVDRERLDEAIDCYQRMLKIDSGLAVTHNALGWLLQEEGRLDESLEHLRTSLRLRPDFGIAQLNLGALHEKLGDFTAAETSMRRALGDPEAAPAALAGLALLLRGSLPEADAQAIQKRLATAGPADPTRVNLLFGLACVWDANRRYAEAAGAAREANALALAQLERRKLAYNPAEHDRLVASLIATFDPAFFARLSGAGLDTDRPVFVVGLPRSGTTLVEQILASHSAIHGAGELPLARQAFQEIPELLDRAEPPASCLAGLVPETVRQLAVAYEARLRQRAGGTKPRIVDKMPDNYVHLGLLATLFPRAVWIHCRRDPRDVAVSCWLTGFGSVRWTSDVRHIASRIHAHDRLMNHWRAVVPAPIHEVDYEETVTDLEAVARRLVAACGMEWEPACLEFHRTRRPVHTASCTQVRRPVYQSSVGRWKNYQTDLADLLAAL
jgi:tetratricopeptide (TPR) repeat protein